MHATQIFIGILPRQQLRNVPKEEMSIICIFHSEFISQWSKIKMYAFRCDYTEFRIDF